AAAPHHRSSRSLACYPPRRYQLRYPLRRDAGRAEEPAAPYRGGVRREQLERAPEKACPGPDPGWEPVSGQDHAQTTTSGRCLRLALSAPFRCTVIRIVGCCPAIE